jgi:hypothetical protein
MAVCINNSDTEKNGMKGVSSSIYAGEVVVFAGKATILLNHKTNARNELLAQPTPSAEGSFLTVRALS